MTQDNDPISFSATTDLAMRAAAGDREATAQLYTRYLEALRLFVLHQVGTGPVGVQELEDQLQDGFVAALESLRSGGFDPRKGSFFAWMRTLIARDVIDRRRRDARNPVRASEGASARAVGRAHGVATELGVSEDRQAIMDHVRAQVPKLRERYLSVLALRDVLQLSPHEAAAELGWSYRQVVDAYHRARGAIHKLLTRGEADWMTYLDAIEYHHRVECPSEARRRLVDPDGVE